jgi:hypothetical protein
MVISIKTMSFNFHNVVTMKIVKKEEKKLEKFFSHLDMEYDYFRVVDVKNPDITLVIGDFVPNNKDCKFIDHKFYVKKDYIYFEDSYKIAKWKAEITGFETGKIKIRVKSNLFGYLFFDGYILEFLLKYAMLQKGYCLVHAGGVSKQSKAIVFPARGSAGKTTVSLHMVKNGYDFLGDDCVIIGPKKVLPFPSFLHVFNYHITRMPTFEENLNASQKALIKLKYLVYHASGKYAKFFTYLKFKDVFPQAEIARESKLHSLVFIIKKNTGQLEIKKIPKDEAVKSLLYDMKIESYPFNHYMEAYSFIFPKSKLSDTWNLFEKTFFDDINVPCYKIEVSDYNERIMKKITDFLENLK